MPNQDTTVTTNLLEVLIDSTARQNNEMQCIINMVLISIDLEPLRKLKELLELQAMHLAEDKMQFCEVG